MRIKLFSLFYLTVLLFSVLFSFVSLLYLVLADTYFRYLDFKSEQFALKIGKYLLMTFYVPILFTIIFSVYLFLKQSAKNEKKVILLSSILAIITFTYFGKFVIKFLIFEKILMSLIIAIILFLVAFIFSFKKLNDLKKHSEIFYIFPQKNPKLSFEVFAERKTRLELATTSLEGWSSTN